MEMNLKGGPRATTSALLAMLACCLLAACGEFTYKRGAGQSELARDRAECRSAANAPSGYEQCMKARGWVVQKLDDMPSMAVASVTTDNRAMAPGTSIEAGASAATVVGGDGPSTAVAVPKSPLDTFKVGSMWKFGGDSKRLDADIDACVSTLGEAHRPRSDGEQRLMTRGLLSCLGEKGWYGLASH